MATSGSVNFSVNRNDIINAAAEEIGVLALGQTMTSTIQTPIALRLNALVKQWQGKADFAPGLKEWSRKRGTLFLQTNTVEYSLGPSGDHATNSYVSTTLTAAAATSATSLTVGSITGISNADNIGIALTDGTLHWDTVSGAPSGSTVTLTTGLASGASANAKVYAYTTKINRPIQVLTAVLRNSENTDSPLTFITLEEYEALTNKRSDGTPTRILVEGQLTNIKLYTDYEPDDVTKQIRFTYLSPIEDFDAATDTPDYPQSWYRALYKNLAIEIAPMFSRQVNPLLTTQAAESLAIAKNEYPEETVMYFQPGLD